VCVSAECGLCGETPAERRRRWRVIWRREDGCAARRDKLAMGEHLPACACGSGVGVCAHCNYIVTAGPAYNYYGSSDCSLPSPARSPGFRKSFSSYPGRQSSTAHSPLPLPTSCSYSRYIIIIMI